MKGYYCEQCEIPIETDVCYLCGEAAMDEEEIEPTDGGAK